MKSFEWLDKLSDNEISSYLKKEAAVKEFPYFLDQKLLRMIRDKENIAQKRKKKQLANFYRCAVLTAAVFIFAFFTYIFTGIFNKNQCIVINIEGGAYSIPQITNKKTVLKNDSKIKVKSTVITEMGAELNLKFGKKSTAEIKDKSEIKLINSQKSKTGLYIALGKAYFDIKLPTKESTFEVESDSLKIIVKGTRFNFAVNSEKSTTVEVIEGSVLIKPKLIAKNSYIDKHFKDIAIKINDAVSLKSVLNEGESLTISLNEKKTAEIEINKILKSLEENFRSQTKLDETKSNLDKIRQIRNNLIKIKLDQQSQNGKISQIEQVENKKEKKLAFKTEKNKITENLVFGEKGTYITTFNNNILIASAENNTLYCIDPLNGNVLWKFSGNSKLEITSPPLQFNSEIILGTPYKIFVLDNNGKIKIEEQIKSGPKYWASPIIIDKKVFIPASQDIYIYDGIKISARDKFPEILGQIYISGASNELCYVDSNEQKVKIYSLNENKILWESQKILNRSFTAPLLTDKNIYLSDMKNSIYKFDRNSSAPIKSLNIGSGVLTNLILQNNFLYFIAIDGWLYKADKTKMILPKKIAKVDKNPNNDKYLTKKIFTAENELYFSSDTGALFYYDIENEKQESINPDNMAQNPLVGTPVIINDIVCVVDTAGNIYRVRKTFE